MQLLFLSLFDRRMDKVEDALTIIILCEVDQVVEGKPRVPNTYFREFVKGVKTYSHIYIYNV